jgi:hypothetical protein
MTRIDLSALSHHLATRRGRKEPIVAVARVQGKPRQSRLCWVSPRISPAEVYLCLLLLSPYG